MLEKTLLNYSVVLVQPKIKGNIGAIARLCNNYNAKNLILIDPQVDHLSSESRARAMHSLKYLENAEIYPTLSDIRGRFTTLIATTAKAGEQYKISRQPLLPWDFTELKIPSNAKIGVVFGREDIGLLNEEIDMCDILVNVPLPGEHKVLNLSHAVAILLHELWKASTAIETIKKQERMSTYNERKILFDEVEKILVKIEYFDHKRTIANKLIQKIINRSFPNHHEIHSLIGFFKAIRRKLEKKCRWE